jgi:hypothetical protein
VVPVVAERDGVFDGFGFLVVFGGFAVVLVPPFVVAAFEGELPGLFTIDGLGVS